MNPWSPTESWLGPVQFSPSGQQFLVSLAGGTMEVWRTTNATTPICRFKPEGRPAKLEFSPDESRLLTGTVAAREFVFQVWDITNGEAVDQGAQM